MDGLSQKPESVEKNLFARFKESQHGTYLCLEVPRPDIQLPEEGLLDRGEWHITIIQPSEYGAIKNRWKILPEEVRFVTEPRYIGLGKAEEEGNATYFVVVDWPEAQQFRVDNGLEPADLHITVAFRKKDIYGVRKDISTLIQKF